MAKAKTITLVARSGGHDKKRDAVTQAKFNGIKMLGDRGYTFTKKWREVTTREDDEGWAAAVEVEGTKPIPSWKK